MLATLCIALNSSLRKQFLLNWNTTRTKDERIEQLHGEKERLEYERLMASQKSSRRRRASGSEGMPRSTGLELRLGLANRGCATQAGL